MQLACISMHAHFDLGPELTRITRTTRISNYKTFQPILFQLASLCTEVLVHLSTSLPLYLFSYKSLDRSYGGTVIDCRSIRNPHFAAALCPLVCKITTSTTPPSTSTFTPSSSSNLFSPQSISPLPSRSLQGPFILRPQLFSCTHSLTSFTLST